MTTTVEATSGPANSTTTDGGHRTYTHPITGEKFVSVTSALKVLGKEALVFWAAKVVAEQAMDYLPRLVKASRRRPCGDTGRDRCRECRQCAVIELKGHPVVARDEAGDLGKAVHKAVEHSELHGEWPAVVVIRSEDGDPREYRTDTGELAPFLDQYRRFRAAYKPTFEASEMTVISREYGYAGTLDGIMRLGWCPPKHRNLVGSPLTMDIKSGKGVYVEAALQLAAYRHAEAVMLPNGEELPLPPTNDTAVVLHLRPDTYHVYPVDAGQATFGAFLSTLAVHRWQAGLGGDAIDRAMCNPREKSATAKTSKPRGKAAASEGKKPATAKKPPAKRQTRRVDPVHVLGKPAATNPTIPF